MLIKTDLREIRFEMWNGFSWHRRRQLLWKQNINICCSCTIKQFKLIIKYINKISISHQSDKCANECPIFSTKHQHKPVRVQISLQPLEAGKISWSHDIHPCMWHSSPAEDAGMTPFRSMYMFIMRSLFSCCGKFRSNMGADVSTITKTPATNRYIKGFTALMYLLFLYIEMTSLYWNSTLSVMRNCGANVTHSEFPYFLKETKATVMLKCSS